MSESKNQENLTLMTEIQNRLRKTEEHAATVIRTLEKDQSMQDSIDAASKGLHETNSAVAEFADKIKQATEVFLESVSALREVTSVLQKINPSDLQLKLDQITQQIAEGSEKLHANMEAMNQRVDQQNKQLHKNMEQNYEQLVNQLQESTEAMNERGDQQSKKLQKGITLKHTKLLNQLQESTKAINKRADQTSEQLSDKISSNTILVVVGVIVLGLLTVFL